ncbi:MAG: phytoene desaturase family protein [Candidatus Freyarchaeota archaeon]
MISRNYDVVIIGAGLAGLTVGALLSSEEQKKVLVLEKEDFLGGRLASFVGEGDHLLIQGKKLTPEDFKKVLGSVYTWVCRTEPDLNSMFERKLLDGYTFEAGGHATFWGNRGRLSHLLDYLGKHLDMPGNEGFCVIDPETKKLYPLQRGGKYGWMSEESNRIAKTLLREMITASDEDLAEWDKISFGKWMKDRTKDRKVYEYLAAIASIHMVMGEPDMIPAGDFIRFMRTAVRIGMNLITGSTGIIPKPGFVRVAERIAEKIEESGGNIITGTRVTEVLFEGKKVKGVKAETASGEETFIADQVVCTVPINKVWSFLPKRLFPKEFVKKVDEEFSSIGMLTGYVGLTRNVFADAGIHPKSWLLVPAVIKAEEGYIGDVDIISIMPSNFAPSLAPEGKYTLGFSIALTGKELRNKAKVDRVIDVSRELFHTVFPTMAEATEFELWTCSDQGFGVWPPPGEERPDTTMYEFDGLYFAGDCYGAKTWGSGMDAAVFSALLCVDAITGKNYVEKILPEYHR